MCERGFRENEIRVELEAWSGVVIVDSILTG